MRFDTKIAIVVRDDLAGWQRLNVTAFLASGVAGTDPEIIGKPYLDGSDREYLPMFRQPVLVFTATAAELARTHARALSRLLPTAVYTAEMFTTGHDEANREAVRAVPTDELDLVGLGLYGRRADVDKVVKGLSLHP
jgi:hypothetical protein